MQVENIINNFKEQLTNFVAYESKMIDNSNVSVIELSGTTGISKVKTYPNGVVRIENVNGYETDYSVLELDTMCNIATEVENKFRSICKM